MIISSDEILKLSVSERLDLIEAVWDSIAAEPESLPITDAQRRELDHRLESYTRDPSRFSSWDEVRARLERAE